MKSLLAIATIFMATAAHAQLPLPGGTLPGLPGIGIGTPIMAPTVAGPGVPVFDQAVTQNTAISAESLIVGGGSGRYMPQSALLTALMQTISAGAADPATFAEQFVGWVDPTANSSDYAAAVTGSVLTLYANAIYVAKLNTANFANENTGLAALEACNSARGITTLQAIQCGNENTIALIQQIQLERQLQATQIIVTAVAHAEEINERAGSGAWWEWAFLNAAQSDQ